MDDQVQFLHARLGEDEQAARAAAPGPWSETGRDSVGEGMVHSDSTGWAIVGSVKTGHGPDAPYANVSLNAAHIARHDPARVLADVEAKRRMIGRIDSHATIMGWDEVHGDLLRLLALPFADHPAYRETWKP